MTIGELLKETRVTRREIADFLEISDPCVWRWIRKADANRLEPEKLARLHIAIQTIAESKKGMRNNK